MAWLPLAETPMAVAASQGSRQGMGISGFQAAAISSFCVSVETVQVPRQDNQKVQARPHIPQS